MLLYIKELRKKSVRERKTVAFFISASITGLIFILWLISITIGRYELSSADSKKPITPFNSILHDIRGAFDNAKDAVFGASSTPPYISS